MSTESGPEKRSSIQTLMSPRGSSSGGGEGMDRKLEKKTWTPRRVGMIAGGLFFIFALFWIANTTRGGRKLNVNRDRVTVSEVVVAPFQENIPATGNVEPRTTVFLDAVEGGRIEEIYVIEGEIVEEGQPILRLSNNSLRLTLLAADQSRIEQNNRLEDTRFRVEQANLNMRQQLIDMDYAIRRLKRDLDRLTPLYERSLISKAEFEQTRDEHDYFSRRRALTVNYYQQDSLRQRIQIDQMEEAVSRMDASFSIINKKLEDLTLLAPVSGQLSQLNAELGQQKNMGFRFGQIDVLDGFKVRAAIDEFYITRVVHGQRALTNKIADVEYPMVVRRVYPEVVSSRFEIDLEFVGIQPPTIRRGQTIRFKLEMSDPEDATTIPLGGFFQTTGGNWIYVVDPSGEYANKRDIRLGRKNLRVYEVLEGLQPGEQVVTSSYETFGDADRLVFK